MGAEYGYGGGHSGTGMALAPQNPAEAHRCTSVLLFSDLARSTVEDPNPLP